MKMILGAAVVALVTMIGAICASASDLAGLLSLQVTAQGPVRIEIGQSPAQSPSPSQDLLAKLSLGKGLSDAHCEIGSVNRSTSDDEIIAVLTACINSTTSKADRAQYLVIRAALYLKKRDPKSAIADCDEAVALSPRLVEAYEIRGLAHLTSNEIDPAIADFSAAIDIPAGRRPLFARGTCYFIKRDWKSATGDFTQVIKLNPEVPYIYSARAAAETNSGDFKAAVDDFSEDIRRHPGAALVYNNRGNAYSQLADCKHALEDFNHSIILDANLSVPVINKSETLSTCEDDAFRDGPQAVALAHKALGMALDGIFMTLAAHEALATADAETGNFDEAIKEAQVTLTLAKKSNWPEIITRTEKILAIISSHKPVRLPHDAPLVS